MLKSRWQIIDFLIKKNIVNYITSHEIAENSLTVNLLAVTN